MEPLLAVQPHPEDGIQDIARVSSRSSDALLRTGRKEMRHGLPFPIGEPLEYMTSAVLYARYPISISAKGAKISVRAWTVARCERL